MRGIINARRGGELLGGGSVGRRRPERLFSQVILEEELNLPDDRPMVPLGQDAELLVEA